MDAGEQGRTQTDTVAPALKVVEVPIDQLRPDPANPRRISSAELEALTRSLKEWGFVEPVLALKSDNTVIGGHQRLLAARRLGYKTVPVTFLDLTLEQARLLNLALNQISGDWDQELLARMLADLKPVEDIDLSLSGFSDDELGKLLRSLDHRERRERPEAFDLDAALEAAQAAPRAQPGDLWALGDHRLLCGDSTDAVVVARLMDGRKAAMAFCDPPYNVGLGDHGGQQRGQRKRRLQNDALSPEAWDEFVCRWTRNLLTSVDGALYVCMAIEQFPLISRAFTDAGGHTSDVIIWSKDRFVLGRADYHRGYEPILYGWREGVKRHWSGARDQSNLLFMGGSDVTFFDDGPSSSLPALTRDELSRRYPEVLWTFQAELIYPSAEMPSRAARAMERCGADVIHLLLGANTFIEETVLFSIRRRHPRLYPLASRVIGLGKQAAGGRSEGSASVRGLLFRVPRSFARSLVGTSSLIDFDVALSATQETLELLASKEVGVVCRLAGGGVQQVDQKAAAETKTRRYNDAVRLTCERLDIPCWRLIDELGDRYGWAADGLHADLPSGMYAARRLADLTVQSLGFEPTS